ncbi:MAG: hypothetical protein EI684_19460 [Candidatus Viridilinea halotolerans]|uniref:Uncharacterized protein n=1 Tax=Candidatus Viridilinea halotolerans TaxID=2491704 RepID=A0A426TSM7_9CHLR|nr:MAG: hypothetical protein EI684_19460 [Candidatus Viridilinea halotolerans]
MEQLQLQAAQLGINTPPEVRNEIHDLEQEIGRLSAAVQAVSPPVNPMNLTNAALVPSLIDTIEHITLRGKKGVVASRKLGGMVRNFIIEAEFTNPDTDESVNWTYGFFFRKRTLNDQGDSENYELFVERKSCQCTLRVSRWINRRSQYDVIGTRRLSTLRSNPGERNLLCLIVIDETAFLIVNGRYIDFPARVAKLPEGGAIGVCEGVRWEEGMDGKTITVNQTSLWSLDS